MNLNICSLVSYQSENLTTLPRPLTCCSLRRIPLLSQEGCFVAYQFSSLNSPPISSGIPPVFEGKGFPYIYIFSLVEVFLLTPCWTFSYPEVLARGSLFPGDLNQVPWLGYGSLASDSSFGCPSLAVHGFPPILDPGPGTAMVFWVPSTIHNRLRPTGNP